MIMMLYYWPSYEMVTSRYRDNPFIEDNRHLTATMIKTIMDSFVRYYCKF